MPDYEVVPPEEEGQPTRRRRAKPRMPTFTIERYGGRLIYFWFGMRFGALMKRLRVDHPDLKIIFISGYAEDSFRRNLPDNEDFMFLQKPFDLKELAAAVKAALQG